MRFCRITKIYIGATNLKIVVVGATGDVGRRVVARLCDIGHAVVATSRSVARADLIDRRAETAITSINDAATLAPLLASADRVINIGHASTVERLIPLVPPTCQRLITVGSTRRYSAVPDRGTEDVRTGESVFLNSGLPGCMLHPAMIYGGDGEQNITRILALVARWPRWLPLLWPVPGSGDSLMQPVYIDDVASAIVAAVTAETPIARTIVVAGPEPITLADMLRQSAAVYGRRLFIVPVPVNLLIGAVRFWGIFSKKSFFSIAELQRTREDKSYDIDPLRSQLGIEPRSFMDGLCHYRVRHSETTEIGFTEQSAGS